MSITTKVHNYKNKSELRQLVRVLKLMGFTKKEVVTYFSVHGLLIS